MTTDPTRPVDEGGMSQRAVSGLAWSFAQSWGGRLLSTAVFVILGRLLVPEDFGLVALAAVFIEVGNTLTVSGFHRAIVQRPDLEDEHLDAAFWASAAIGLSLTVAAWIAAPALASAFEEPDFEPILRVMSFSFVLSGVGSTPAAILHRNMAFRTFAIRQFVATAAGGTAAVVLAFADFGAWALVAQALVSPAVGLVIVFAAARWRPHRHLSRRHLRQLSTFGGQVLGSDLLSLTIRRADDLLVGLFLGSAALGYYTIAYRTYAILLEVIVHSVSAVAFPVFSRIAEDKERMARAVLTTARLGAIVMVPAFVGVSVMAPQLIPVVFGEQWDPSIPVLRILSIAALVTSVTFFVKELMLAVGRAGWELALNAASTVAMVIAFRIGVEWGIVGVAWAKLAHDVIFGPLGVEVVRRFVPFSRLDFIRQLAFPVMASAAMGLAVLGAMAVFDPPPSIVSVSALASVGALVYVLLLRLAARSQFDEVVSYATPLARRLRRR